MLRARVIPLLLIEDGGLVKTIQFNNPRYIGDPINAVKIFNDKEVDELILLDIKASTEKREPNYELISKITSECFMPLCYGGGISSIECIQKILKSGVEKVSINSEAIRNPKFIQEASLHFGSSAIVVSMDVKKDFFGNYFVYKTNGKIKSNYKAVDYAMLMEQMGAGELLVNSIDKDGTKSGYDLNLVNQIAEVVGIPTIACGGASGIADFLAAFKSKASAVAAGSLFVFYGKMNGILINYPSPDELKEKLFNKL